MTATADWYEINPNTSWAARIGHRAIYDGTYMWVAGGFTSAAVNDIWRSDDLGITWELAKEHAEWSARSFFGFVYVNSKYYVFGGSAGGSFLNDVWVSDDCISWTQVTTSTIWTGRDAFAYTAYDGTIWVAGGNDNDGPEAKSNEVWYSVDGAAWTQVTSLPAEIRNCCMVGAWGRLVIISGSTNNYYSDDYGTSWIPYTSQWGAEQDSVVGHDGHRFIFTSGRDYLDAVSNYTWVSEDGILWELATSGVTYQARAYAQLVTSVPSGTLGISYLLGGSGEAAYNDVWYTEYSETTTTESPTTAAPTTPAPVIYWEITDSVDGGGGSIIANGDIVEPGITYVLNGNGYSFTMYADPGNYCYSWQYDTEGEMFCPEGRTSFSPGVRQPILSDHTLVVKFLTKPTYLLTMTNDGNGTTLPPVPVITVYYPYTQAIYAIANTGYVFDNWSVVSGGVYIADRYSATTSVYVYSDATLLANFKEIPEPPNEADFGATIHEISHHILKSQGNTGTEPPYTDVVEDVSTLMRSYHKNHYGQSVSEGFPYINIAASTNQKRMTIKFYADVAIPYKQLEWDFGDGIGCITIDKETEHIYDLVNKDTWLLTTGDLPITGMEAVPARWTDVTLTITDHSGNEITETKHAFIYEIL
jgi:hypothetical protein